jgi:hypothetical protein
MRKIVAGLFVSLDGVTEAPETWQLPYVNDEHSRTFRTGVVDLTDRLRPSRGPR